MEVKVTVNQTFNISVAAPLEGPADVPHLLTAAPPGRTDPWIELKHRKQKHRM